MKVRVNTDRCVGNGVCEALAPDLFTVTDDGQARVLADEIPDAQRESAMQAVQGCPARALAAED
ncbi:Ferredoxin [Mycolicibacterium hassiacum DSM 44199]|nr:ferredoxin [Mycolicibacterium hassiacum]MBX5488825.1 ferredoxin [Mycolicibacterium hassiacum]VCT88658.1 Ferredoxin [Mycolicibacterium hassiacum DSM 44199]